MDPNSIYLKILEKPENKFINNQYTSTLKLISENYRSFYDGKIAKDIVKKVNQNKDNNKLSISDLKNLFFGFFNTFKYIELGSILNKYFSFLSEVINLGGG